MLSFKKKWYESDKERDRGISVGSAENETKMSEYYAFSRCVL